jgi:hypothetical protein
MTWWESEPWEPVPVTATVPLTLDAYLELRDDWAARLPHSIKLENGHVLKNMVLTTLRLEGSSEPLDDWRGYATFTQRIPCAA